MGARSTILNRSRWNCSIAGRGHSIGLLSLRSGTLYSQHFVAVTEIAERKSRARRQDSRSKKIRTASRRLYSGVLQQVSPEEAKLLVRRIMSAGSADRDRLLEALKESSGKSVRVYLRLTSCLQCWTTRLSAAFLKRCPREDWKGLPEPI
jgi:hypothetical protein